MANIQRWHLELKNEHLDRIYKNYIYKVDLLLKYYLSCVAFDKFTVFKENDLGESIAASNNFHDVATSIRSLNDIKEMRDSGEFSCLSRHQCFIALMSAFTDFFEELLLISDIKAHEIKKPVELSVSGKIFLIRPACLKIAHYLSNKYGLIEPLTGNQGTLWINTLINIRHMLVHSQGKFNEEYREFVQLPWSRMQHGEDIKFDENFIDSVIWFLSDNLRPFVRALDGKSPILSSQKETLV